MLFHLLRRSCLQNSLLLRYYYFIMMIRKQVQPVQHRFNRQTLYCQKKVAIKTFCSIFDVKYLFFFKSGLSQDSNHVCHGLGLREGLRLGYSTSICLYCILFMNIDQTCDNLPVANMFFSFFIGPQIIVGFTCFFWSI